MNSERPDIRFRATPMTFEANTEYHVLSKMVIRSKPRGRMDMNENRERIEK